MTIVGLLFFMMTTLFFFFLVPDPDLEGYDIQELDEEMKHIERLSQKKIAQKDGEGLLDSGRKALNVTPSSQEPGEPPERHIGFWKAWMIPRVALYALTFFCTKFVVFSFLLNLPL